MSEGIYITKTDFNMMMKKINFIEQYIFDQRKASIRRISKTSPKNEKALHVLFTF